MSNDVHQLLFHREIFSQSIHLMKLDQYILGHNWLLFLINLQQYLHFPKLSHEHFGNDGQRWAHQHELLSLIHPIRLIYGIYSYLVYFHYNHLLMLYFPKCHFVHRHIFLVYINHEMVCLL